VDGPAWGSGLLAHQPSLHGPTECIIRRDAGLVGHDAPPRNLSRQQRRALEREKRNATGWIATLGRLATVAVTARRRSRHASHLVAGMR
jgi:hypothetical protein